MLWTSHFVTSSNVPSCRLCSRLSLQYDLLHVVKSIWLPSDQFPHEGASSKYLKKMTCHIRAVISYIWRLEFRPPVQLRYVFHVFIGYKEPFPDGPLLHLYTTSWAYYWLFQRHSLTCICLYDVIIWTCFFAGKLWSRSVKLAYNLLHKLGTKQEPLVRPGDRVSGKHSWCWWAETQRATERPKGLIF